MRETTYEELKLKHPELNWNEADDVFEENLEAAAELYDRIKDRNFINEIE